MFATLKEQLDKNLIKVFYALSALIVVSLFLAIITEQNFILLIPFLVVGGVITILDYKLVFYFLIICLPLSFSVYLGGNAFVELPTEPLMILFLVIVLFRPFVVKNYDFKFNHHTLSLFMIAQLLWLIPVTLNSTDLVISVKYLVSKYWYIGTFFFATGIFIKKVRDFKLLFWLLFVPALLVSFIITFRHATHNFEFYWANYINGPFYDNHVIYGTYMATILPYVFFARKWYAKGTWKYRLLNYGFFYFIFAVGISYTRASWLSLIIIVAVYFLMKWKLIKPTIIAALIVLAGLLTYILSNYKYVEYAPNFEKTIFHEGDIAGHLAATYSFEDVSGMERIYRWVAAKNMIAARPWLGFGTNCFYDNYRHYAVRSFETYVSDNPEKSTTHNYFIMVASEQGIFGSLLFLSLCIAILVVGQRVYHEVEDKELRNIGVAATLSMTVLIFHLLLNDLIETDKLGTLFFMALAILIRVDLWNKSKRKLDSGSSN